MMRGPHGITFVASATLAAGCVGGGELDASSVAGEGAAHGTGGGTGSTGTAGTGGAAAASGASNTGGTSGMSCATAFGGGADTGGEGGAIKLLPGDYEITVGSPSGAKKHPTCGTPFDFTCDPESIVDIGWAPDPGARATLVVDCSGDPSHATLEWYWASTWPFACESLTTSGVVLTADGMRLAFSVAPDGTPTEPAEVTASMCVLNGCFAWASKGGAYAATVTQHVAPLLRTSSEEIALPWRPWRLESSKRLVDTPPLRAPRVTRKLADGTTTTFSVAVSSVTPLRSDLEFADWDVATGVSTALEYDAGVTDVFGIALGATSVPLAFADPGPPIAQHDFGELGWPGFVWGVEQGFAKIESGPHCESGACVTLVASYCFPVKGVGLIGAGLVAGRVLRPVGATSVEIRYRAYAGSVRFGTPGTPVGSWTELGLAPTTAWTTVSSAIGFLPPSSEIAFEITTDDQVSIESLIVD